MPENYAKPRPLPFALREVQRDATNSIFWMAIAGIIIVIAISGPFGTLTSLNFPKRLAYWGAIVVFTYFSGTFVSHWVNQALMAKLTNRYVRIFLAALAGSIPITLIVWFTTTIIASLAPPRLDVLLEMAAQCVPIAVIITCATFFIGEEMASKAAPEALANTKVSPFFERLPVALGRDIISIQSQDHYLRVVTTKGSEMILMRMADAIKELETINGVQTHRSWWVAKKHIADVMRDNGKVTVVLSDGEVVPVSRGRVKELPDI